jgi:hypothetical protein
MSEILLKKYISLQHTTQYQSMIDCVVVWYILLNNNSNL